MPLEVRSLAEWEADGVAGLLSVVIPAHNEEGRIAGDRPRDPSRAHAPPRIPHEILVVNDNSSDRTEADPRRAARTSADAAAPQQQRRRTASASRSAPGSRRSGATRSPSSWPTGRIRPTIWSPTIASCRKATTACSDRGSCAAREIVDYPWPKLLMNRLANFFIRMLFWMSYNDVTNAFKLYRRTVIAGVQPLLAYHFNLTVELPLKAIVRGYSYAVVPTVLVQPHGRRLQVQDQGNGLALPLHRLLLLPRESICPARTTASVTICAKDSCRSGRADLRENSVFVNSTQSRALPFMEFDSTSERRSLARYLHRSIVFQEPDRLVDPPSWLEHIPFAFWIVDGLRPDALCRAWHAVRQQLRGVCAGRGRSALVNRVLLDRHVERRSAYRAV